MIQMTFPCFNIKLSPNNLFVVEMEMQEGDIEQYFKDTTVLISNEGNELSMDFSQDMEFDSQKWEWHLDGVIEDNHVTIGIISNGYTQTNKIPLNCITNDNIRHVLENLPQCLRHLFSSE